MTLLSNLLSILRIAAKRLWANKGLTLSLLLGWTTAVGLSLCVPLYANAVNYRMLREELETTRERTPPFAFMFRYIGAWHGAIDWDDVQQVDAYMQGPVAADIGLPLERVTRYFKTDSLRLFPASEATYADMDEPLEWVNVGFISELASHITLLDGTFPELSPTDSAVEVLLYHKMADELGLQVGEEYVLFGEKESGARGGESVEIHVRISGVWQAANPEEVYWFYNPESFERILLLPEASFHQKIAPVLEKEVYLGLWYMLLDGSAVYNDHVPRLLGRIITAQTRAALILPLTSLDISPVEALQKYRSEARLLTVLLFVFAIPVLGLILYFVALTAGMAVRRQQTEIAVLRSRGTSRWQVMGVYLIEGLALGVVALGLGVLLGQAIALSMGQVRSFLTLVARPPLVLHLSWSSLRFAVGAVVLALLTTLLPALSAAAHTIVTHKQEQARTLRRPLWQRYFLDFFLLVPPLYGYYLLRQQGALSVNLGEGAASDPFQNPLLFLAPTLFIFALGAVFIRFFPLLMSVLAWLAGWLPGTPSVLALRHLARSSGQYTGPLLLLILTLGLAAFTASMALTLDEHLVDQMYYQVGGDVRLDELGESTEEPTSFYAPQPQAEDEEEEVGPKWLFLPVSQHLDAEGVRAATRVGAYKASSTLDGRESGTFVGIDRVDFPSVAFFRSDFASASLGGLMNHLAQDPRALLVERGFLARNALRIGDALQLKVTMSGENHTIEYIVAGTLDMFPTQYPGEETFFVGDLDYTFQQVGDEHLYDVWLATDGERSTQAIVDELKSFGFLIFDYDDARAMILKEQTQPSRQGLFGVLSVGFLAAAGLTMLGFLLYAIFSFRQRFIELGVLRAIGLSVGQMVAFLAGEQLALILTGAITGTGLGVWASRLFIPYLQVRGGQHPHTPPFVVQIAWTEIDQIYIVFGCVLFVGVALMTVLLARMRVFEAVKLGEVA